MNFYVHEHFTGTVKKNAVRTKSEISRAESASQPSVSVLYTLMRTSNGERAVIYKVSFVVIKYRSCDLVVIYTK